MHGSETQLIAPYIHKSNKPTSRGKSVLLANHLSSYRSVADLNES